MRVVFFGTSEFAKEILEKLNYSEHEVVLVVTQPDARKNRGHKIHFSPIKEKALELGLNIFQPENVNDDESFQRLIQAKADIFIIVSFGSILKKHILNIPKYEAINVHPSLLPLYRGAAPIQRAIMDGRKKTGVTIMKMTERLDAGDILLQQEINLDESWNYKDLSEKLSLIGGKLLIEAMRLIVENKLIMRQQDESLHSYAKKILKEEKFIDFNMDSETIRNKIRGLVPKVTPLIVYKNHFLGIMETVVYTGEEISGIPGEIIEIDKDKGILVKCKTGALWIRRLKPEGKKDMHFKDFLNGNKLSVADVFLSKEGN